MQGTLQLGEHTNAGDLPTSPKQSPFSHGSAAVCVSAAVTMTVKITSSIKALLSSTVSLILSDFIKSSGRMKPPDLLSRCTPPEPGLFLPVRYGDSVACVHGPNRAVTGFTVWQMDDGCCRT